MTAKRLLAWTISLAICAETFSGTWQYAGLPSLDRALFAAAVAIVVLAGVHRLFTNRLRLRAVHILLVLSGAYALVSSLAAGTFSDQSAKFALLDRLGLIPFVMFCLAPIVFDTDAQRKVLLKVFIGTGAYLGLIACFEGVGLGSLVFPRFIMNPLVGIHFGRARGPFLESGANGLAMFVCAAAAGVGYVTWRKRGTRAICATVGLMCLAGTIFTLTRAVWIGAALGCVVAIVCTPRLRRWLLPLAAVAGVTILIMFQLVPNLTSNADSRATDQSPIWDRLNTNAAAIDMVEQRPLFGYGWQTFSTESLWHLRQADTYPLTGAGLEVHNVFLSHAAELGLVGFLLWIAAASMAIGGALVRRGPPELAPWRVALAAITAAFLVSAMLSPTSAAFPNVVLWTWAGIVARDYFVKSNRPSAARPAATISATDG